MSSAPMVPASRASCGSSSGWRPVHSTWRPKEHRADHSCQLVHVIKPMRAARKGHNGQSIPNDLQGSLRVDDFVTHVEGNEPLAIHSKRKGAIGIDRLFSQGEPRAVVCCALPNMFSE